MVYFEKLNGYLDQNRYLKFLENLKKYFPGRFKNALFFDGLSLHTTK
jgi:hypothetical protein